MAYIDAEYLKSFNYCDHSQGAVNMTYHIVLEYNKLDKYFIVT